jgi:transcription elongation factor Elf1
MPGALAGHGYNQRSEGSVGRRRKVSAPAPALQQPQQFDCPECGKTNLLEPGQQKVHCPLCGLTWELYALFVGPVGNC